MDVVIRERIAQLMYWQRQVTNAREVLRGAFARRDRELVRVVGGELAKAETMRDAHVAMLGALSAESLLQAGG